MLTVGLTGPSGAGKGFVASLFSRFGVPSIDTDAIYHNLLIPPSACLDELQERFGAEILYPDGTLNRRALATLVFSEGHSGELADLNRITHRHILLKTRDILAAYEAQGIPAVLVDAPQLFESGFHRECGFILSVLAPFDQRLSRVMTRDGLSEERARARLKASHADEFFREKSDAVIVNDGSVETMESEVRRLLTLWGVTV
ncbi:MAG: dephospho-CoA kinase [Clostridia bacterium]|nr:dephospho-CoA kinase [Clostridia bacterium]